MIDKKKTQGLIIGTRKAGTTWIYENFCNDPRVLVSKKVKESGFFTSATKLDENEYNNLFDETADEIRIEVDTSICYDPLAPEKIYKYNPCMKVILIIRDPVEFLVSRYNHSYRKGELHQVNVRTALLENNWLREELNYAEIVNRFSEADIQLSVMTYAELVTNPIKFYSNVIAALGVSHGIDFIPDVARVNVSRNSKLRYLSIGLSSGAKIARRFGLHKTVNTLKALNFHKKLEKNNSLNFVEQQRKEAQEALQCIMPDTLEFYKTL